MWTYVGPKSLGYNNSGILDQIFLGIETTRAYFYYKNLSPTQAFYLMCLN